MAETWRLAATEDFTRLEEMVAQHLLVRGALDREALIGLIFDIDVLGPEQCQELLQGLQNERGALIGATDGNDPSPGQDPGRGRGGGEGMRANRRVRRGVFDGLVDLDDLHAATKAAKVNGKAVKSEQPIQVATFEL